MRDDLAFAGVFGSVASVEQASTDADEGVVVFTVRVSFNILRALHHLRLQKAVAVSVDGLDGAVVCDTDVIWLDSHDFAQPLVRIVDGLKASSVAALPHQPQVGELCREWRRTFRQTPVSEVWQDIIKHREQYQCPGREKVGDERHLCSVVAEACVR